MVHGFVRRWGGFAILDSEEGRGTSVSLFFPRAAVGSEVPEGTAIEPEATRPGAARGETILFVEDDAELRILAARMLRSLDYRAVPAANGPEALLVLEQWHDIDLLLTDLQLPRGVSGAQLAKQAQELCPGISIIYISAFAEGAIGEAVRSGDAPCIMQKTFSRRELSQLVRRVLDVREA